MSKTEISQEELQKLFELDRVVWELAPKVLPAVPDPAEWQDYDGYNPMQHVQVGVSGDFRIRRTPRHKKWPVITARNSFLYGVPQLQVAFPRPVAFHLLTNGKGILTSDKPNEIYTQYIGLREATGHVLVGGLGLGTALGMLFNLPKVETVWVVEKEKDVIELARPYLTWLQNTVGKDRFSYIHGDVYDMLRTVAKTETVGFDFAYHDIWYQTKEATWAYEVVPLWRASRRANITKMGGWCVRDMQAQLLSGLVKAPYLAPNHPWLPYRVFLAGLRKVGVTLPFTGAPKELIPWIKLYLLDVGSVAWESTFEWPKKEDTK